MLKKWTRESKKHFAGWLLSALAAFLLTSEPVEALLSLPDSIQLTRGYSASISLPDLLKADLTGSSAALSSMDESLSNGVSSVELTGQETGVSSLKLRLMGLFPLKTIPVHVEEEKILIPGGSPVGVAIQTEGVLVVGISDLGGATISPAREAGLQGGDVILALDGVSVTNARHLSSLVEPGETVILTVLRNGQTMTMPLTPVADPRDGVFRLGAWVRDSTAGIGTLSFYDPETGRFGALGHAITDIDTGLILDVRNGEIVESAISEIHKGESGAPGELVGRFGNASQSIGSIEENGVYGIYGNAYAAINNALFPNGIPIMSRDEVRTGPAQILTTLDSSGPHAYDCEIIKLTRQDEPAQRSMVVRITDPELLDKTGGIVQGMSGSPILQDNRLVGAVTHVYVNDPTTGYGLYIEWMLDAAR